MGAKHNSRRGTINISNITVGSPATYKEWLDSLPYFQDTEEAIKPVVDGGGGLGIGDYFKFGKGSSEGIQGSLKQIIEI